MKNIELQSKYQEPETALSQAKQLIQRLQQEKEDLMRAFLQERETSKNLQEQLNNHIESAKTTTQYLIKLSENEKEHRQEISFKNRQLEIQNKVIAEQKKASEKLYKRLIKSYEELKIQRDYLEATMREMQQKNDEMQMQKAYLQATVEDLEDSQYQLKRQKDSLEITVKALERSLEIEKQKTLLEDALQELGTAYDDITDSITYAKRIQDAMLPTHSLLELYFEDHLIFFKPRNIVSGDFYWFKQEQDKFIVIAADCTGHGVPGALMSILGINLLNEIISNKKNTSPEKILQLLDIGINHILDQEKTNNRDGMDIAICTIDLEHKVLEYAGAYNPLLLIQEDTFQVIKADKFGVGGIQDNKEKKFTKKSFSIQKPTTFYIYSDGYQDQFGGQSKKKFMSSNFRQLLFDIHSEPMQVQKNILETTLTNWQGEQVRIDDILILGLRIS